MIDISRQQHSKRAVRNTGFVTFDSNRTGFLRFTSLSSVFPLSIAFPAWSEVIVDLDADGYGTVEFTDALLIRRSRFLRSGQSCPSLSRHAHELRGERCRAELLLQSVFADASTQPALEHWFAPATDLFLKAIPGVQEACVLTENQCDEISFVTVSDMRSAWHVQRTSANVDAEALLDVLRSISWLDRGWFAALPAL